MTLVAVVLVDRHDALSPSESQMLSPEKWSMEILELDMDSWVVRSVGRR